jgi:hypothetical protein
MPKYRRFFLTEKCRPGKKWDDIKCQCVVIECPALETCQPPFVFDEKCDCVCGLTIDDCTKDLPDGAYGGLDLENCGCWAVA